MLPPQQDLRKEVTPTARLKPKSHLERDPAAASPQQGPEKRRNPHRNDADSGSLRGSEPGNVLDQPLEVATLLPLRQDIYRGWSARKRQGLTGHGRCFSVIPPLSVLSVLSALHLSFPLLPSWSTLTKRNCQCQ